MQNGETLIFNKQQAPETDKFKKTAVLPLKELTVNIHEHRLNLQSWLALLALILSVWFIFENVAMLLELTWLLFGAFILSVMIRPIADLLARRHIPRGVTVLLAYGGLLAGIIVVLRLFLPVIGEEVTALRQTMPAIAEQAMGQVNQWPLVHWLPTTDQLVQEFNNQLNTIFLGALSTVAGLGAFLLNLFVLSMIAYFFVTATFNSEHQLWLRLAPDRRSQLHTIFFTMYRRLNRWVWTQLVLGLFHAVAFVTGLLWLGVPFALTLGLLSGLLSLIPYLGVIIAALLAALSALPVSPWLALWVILFMTAVTIISSHVLTPLLYGRTVGLNSLVVLLALFVGARLQGIIGMIFAIPIAVIIDTVLQAIWLPASAPHHAALAVRPAAEEDEVSHAA